MDPQPGQPMSTTHLNLLQQLVQVLDLIVLGRFVILARLCSFARRNLPEQRQLHRFSEHFDAHVTDSLIHERVELICWQTKMSMLIQSTQAAVKSTDLPLSAGCKLAKATI